MPTASVMINSLWQAGQNQTRSIARAFPPSALMSELFSDVVSGQDCRHPTNLDPLTLPQFFVSSWQTRCDTVVKALTQQRGRVVWENNLPKTCLVYLIDGDQNDNLKLKLLFLFFLLLLLLYCCFYLLELFWLRRGRQERKKERNKEIHKRCSTREC